MAESVFLGGGGGTPGGSDTQVQFNESGSFGGDSWHTFDPAQVPGGNASTYAQVIGVPESSVVSYIRGWWAPTSTLLTSDLTSAVGYDQTIGVEASGDLSGIANSVTGMGVVVYGAPVADQLAGNLQGLITTIVVAGTHTVGDVIGYRVGTWDKTGTPTVTRNTGIRIDPQQGLATTNYALHIRDQGNSATDYAIKVDGGQSVFTGVQATSYKSSDGTAGDTEDVVIAGTGTLSFKNGLFVAFTPE